MIADIGTSTEEFPIQPPYEPGSSPHETWWGSGLSRIQTGYFIRCGRGFTTYT